MKHGDHQLGKFAPDAGAGHDALDLPAQEVLAVRELRERDAELFLELRIGEYSGAVEARRMFEKALLVRGQLHVDAGQKHVVIGIVTGGEKVSGDSRAGFQQVAPVVVAEAGDLRCRPAEFVMQFVRGRFPAQDRRELVYGHVVGVDLHGDVFGHPDRVLVRIDDTAEREQGVGHPCGQRGAGMRVVAVQGLFREQLRLVEQHVARDGPGPFVDLAVDDAAEPVQQLAEVVGRRDALVFVPETHVFVDEGGVDRDGSDCGHNKTSAERLSAVNRRLQVGRGIRNSRRAGGEYEKSH